MSRKIWCQNCLPLPLLENEDVALGFKSRVVHGDATRHLVCDQCDCAIKPGDPIKCVTLWCDVEPMDWEPDFVATKAIAP